MISRKQISACALSILFFGIAFVVALPAVAQVEFGGVNMGLSGDLETGYDGSLSSPGSSSHGLGLGGTGKLNGSYYNPNFLSFTVQPYYNRAQANADSASVFDSGGYTGNVNLFHRKPFPGSRQLQPDVGLRRGCLGFPALPG